MVEFGMLEYVSMKLNSAFAHFALAHSPFPIRPFRIRTLFLDAKTS